MQTAENTLPEKKKHAGGRPTKYNNEVLRKAKDYIENYETYGDVIPSIAGLCQEIDLHRDTVHTWAKDKNKKQFSDLIKALSYAQERKLLNGGLKAELNPAITKLVLSKHGYHDNPQANQGNGGITVQVNRGGVVLKSGNQTLEVQTDSSPGSTIEHE